MPCCCNLCTVHGSERQEHLPPLLLPELYATPQQHPFSSPPLLAYQLQQLVPSPQISAAKDLVVHVCLTVAYP